MHLHHLSLFRILVALALVFPAVAGGAAAATPVSSPVAAVAFPDGPVGEQIEWLATQLGNGAQDLGEDDFETRFTPSLLEQVPASAAVAFVQQLLAAYGSLDYRGVARPPTDHQAIVQLEGSTGALVAMSMVVEPEPPHRIDEILLEQATWPMRSPDVSPSEFSGLYDIGGRSLYLDCTGSGSPTVVLESGYNTPTSSWLGIQYAIAPDIRVCTYDRANAPLGASDPAPAPRTGADVVADLHALLEAAGVPGPYVLVGHSIGGIFGRLYASTYPDDVVGLVLVDSSHEEQNARLQALLTEEQQRIIDELSAGLPDAEALDFDAMFAEMQAARSAEPLRPMPLIVLSSGQAPEASLYPPGYPVDAEYQLHRELQEDLVSLVPGARQVIAEQSGHFIQIDQPELVIEAIVQVVEAVRNPASWGTPASGTPVA